MPKRKSDAISSDSDLIRESKKAKKRHEDELKKFLAFADKEDTLIAGLTLFLTTAERDGGEALIDAYIRKFPECGHLLQPLSWDKQKRSRDVVLVCFSCLEQVLLYTASVESDPALASVGLQLTQNILSTHMRAVYSSLVTAAPARLICVCLGLLSAMTTQGPIAAREVQQTFNFGYKPLGLLLSKTDKIKDREDSIRSCLIKFALSFLMVGQGDTISSILETKGFLSSIFGLLTKDTTDIVYLVLSAIKQKVVFNSSVSKRTKSRFFSHNVFKGLSQLLSRNDEIIVAAENENESAKSVPTTINQLAYELMLHLLTDFHHGVPYKPKEVPAGLLRTNNPAILHAILVLSTNLENPLNKELVFSAVSTCPDVLLSFLKQAPITLELKPVSKWLTGVQFFSELFGQLPSVRELMGAGVTSLQHLDVAVGLTVPSITTRAMLSQWLQSAVLLVKHGVLRLLETVLNRASVMVTATRYADAVFCQRYSDSVLKNLPDIKTVISLRQVLLSKKLPAASPGVELTPEQVAKTEELAENNVLLSLTTAVLCGYQTLCPSLYLQVEFGLHRLLPTINAAQQLDKDTPLMARQVLLPSLQLLLNAPQDGTKWLNVTVLKTLVLLLLEKRTVSTLALDLLVKFLSAVDGLESVQLEIKLVLKAFVDQKAHLCLPEAVDFLVDVLLTFTQVSYVFVEKVEDILSGGERSSRDEHEKKLLQKILASSSDDVCHSSDGIQPCHRDSILPLVYCLLTKFVASKLDSPLVLFVSKALLQLLLIRDDYQSFVSVILHSFCTEEFSLKCSKSIWRNLVVSLIRYLTCWCPGSCSQNKIGTPLVELKQLSHKKLQKQIEEQSLLPLLSQATDSQLVSLLRSATTQNADLLSVAAKVCAVRPLIGLSGTFDDGSGFGSLLLPKLAFSTIIMQSVCGGGEVGESSDPPSPCISQRVVDLMSAPGIVCQLREKIREESTDIHLCHYNTRVTLSLFTKIETHVDSTECPNGINAIDSCLSLITEILECKSSSKGTTLPCRDTFLLDFLCNKLICNTKQILSNWTVGETELERGRVVLALLGTVKDHMSSSCAQELFTLLVSSLESLQGSSAAVASDMLQVLLHADKGLSLSEETMTALLGAVVRDKCRALDAVLLTVLSERDKYRVAYCCDEVPCTLHGTGHPPVQQRAEEAPCQHCTVAMLGATIKSIMSALKTKNLIRCEELLHPLVAHPTQSSISVNVPMQRSILEHCLESPDSVRAKIVTVLLQSSSAAYQLFRESGWCDRLSQELLQSKGDTYHGQLLVIEAYLRISHQDLDCPSDLLSGSARKALWKCCRTQLSDPHCTQGHTQSWQNIVVYLCSPALQGDRERLLKRINRIASQLNWKTSGNVAFLISIAKHLSPASCKRVLPPDVWNDLAIEVVKNHLGSSGLVCLLAMLIRKLYADKDDDGLDAYLPLQELHVIIWSHPSFTEIMFTNRNSGADILSAKDELVGLLVAVVGLYPSLCESVQVETLLGAYQATTTKADRGILYLLYLYELNGISLEQYRPFLWGPCALEHYKARQNLGLLLWKQPGPQEVLDLIDRHLMQASSHRFPLDAELEPSDPFLVAESHNTSQPQEPLYDPAFFLPMLSHLLDSSNYVDCRKFVDIGCLGYLLASLSCKNGSVRMAGCHGMSRFLTHMDGSSFREKAQISMMLEVLKHSLVQNNERLPSFFASFLPTVAHILMHPEHHLFRPIAYYLASKPTLDLGDIPLYRTLFLSCSDQRHQEQAWMLRTFVEGLRCAEDYAIFRRRRVLSHVMSLYHLSTTTKEVGGLILQLISRACCIPFVAIDLVWNLGILPWVEQVSLSGEKVACVEILQNLWKCLKSGGLQYTPPAAAPSEQVACNEKQLKRPPLLEEELILTVAIACLNSL